MLYNNAIKKKTRFRGLSPAFITIFGIVWAVICIFSGSILVNKYI